MKILKQGRKNRFFSFLRPANEKFNDKWDKTKKRLDHNPRYTAIWMASILFVCFIWFVYQSVDRIKRPKNAGDIHLLQNVQKQFYPADSGSTRKSITSDFYEYLWLKEIQKELEAMQRDTTKIDTARINQLIEILK